MGSDNPGRSLPRETWLFLRLAAPLVLINLCTTAMQLTDVAMLGHYSRGGVHPRATTTTTTIITTTRATATAAATPTTAPWIDTFGDLASPAGAQLLGDNGGRGDGDVTSDATRYLAAAGYSVTWFTLSTVVLVQGQMFAISALGAVVSRNVMGVCPGGAAAGV